MRLAYSDIEQAVQLIPHHAPKLYPETNHLGAITSTAFLSDVREFVQHRPLPRHAGRLTPHGQGMRDPAIVRFVIGFLVAGLIVGALARLIKPGKQNLGILATLGLGLVGSLIGGLIAQFFGTGSIWELNVLGFVLAVVAAVLLIGAAETIAGKIR